MSNVICARCVSERITEHAYWCDLHPENRSQRSQEPAQRVFMDESDHEAIARLWRALEANP